MAPKAAPSLQVAPKAQPISGVWCEWGVELACFLKSPKHRLQRKPIRCESLVRDASVVVMPASPAAAGIAVKPSYSRGPDGKTPFGVASFRATMNGLLDATKTKSELASSMGRGALAAKDYLKAQDTFGQIATVKTKESAFRVAEEKKRQAAESEKLAQAYNIEKGRFEAEWAERIAAVEADCAERERVLKEVHEVAATDVEKEVQRKIANMRYKATSTLLQMEDMEKKLVRQHEYKDAAEVAARCHRQRIKEEAEYERAKKSMGSRPRAAVVELQEAEMRNLLQKCHALRVAVRREKDQAFEVFKQKYRNLEADLGHAFALEFPLGDYRAEVGEVHAYPSRSKQSSTFRGTLKYESLAGTKFDVPDVSSLAPIPSDEHAQASIDDLVNASKVMRRSMVDAVLP